MPIETIRLALRRDPDAAFAWLTEAEFEALDDRASHAEVLAGRVAAKEAVVKSLGCGFDDEVAWQDVIVSVDDSGAPVVLLAGGAAIVAKRNGVQRILISITHAGEFAAASAYAMT